MEDNITLRKIWQDDDVIELTVVCSSPIITATSEIYVSDSLIDELISEITKFLNGNKEGFWANEERGDASTACVSFRFFREDELGHIAIEVFAELDDGGDYSKHNCCLLIMIVPSFMHGYRKIQSSYYDARSRLFKPQ